MKKFLNLCLLACLCILATICMPTKGAIASASDVVVNGVYIEDVNISGMSKSEAQAAIEAYIEELKQKGVAILVDDEVVYGTIGDMGLTYDYGECLEEALGLGKNGNLIKRYKDLKDIEHGNVIYNITFAFDKAAIEEYVETACSVYNIAPVNASMVRENSEFSYTAHKIGRKVNIEQTRDKIYEALAEWNKMDVVVEAIVEDDMPLYTLEDVQKCNAILGSFSTSYTTSSANRSGNLANGAKLINGTVVYPGDTFSAYQELAPIDTSNGYFMAGAYQSGKVIDSVGGGVCQVSTTLYNAVLFAELEIVERQPHSMSVSYVPLSQDAAIAGTYKDFKFKNNSSVPIYIEGYTRNKVIYFNIWGAETRPANRTIKFESVEVQKTNPGADIITKDKSKPTTYRKVTQSAHYGYKAELYKIIYIDGVESERVLINKSNYQAAPAYITIGTKVEEKPEKEETEEEADKDDKKEDAEVETDTKPSSTKPSKDETTDKNQTDSKEEDLVPEEE